jgi:hypothetical protein
MPEWIEDRRGEYYLYFADHKGRYIRLGDADRLRGPWTIYPPGSLQLEESGFLTDPPTVPAEFAALEARWKHSGVEISHDLLSEVTTSHIASPDAHFDPRRRRIAMYFHGLDDVGTQVTRVAGRCSGSACGRAVWENAIRGAAVRRRIRRCRWRRAGSPCRRP